jgi:uncharacterized protein (TIGR03435 family)
MRTLLAILVASAIAGLAAQDIPGLEVVSIKPTAPNPTGGSFGTRPGGGIVAVNMPVRSLISLAYPLEASDAIEGAPDWFFREGYDVNARTATGLTPERTREIWRAVFADRFKLKARYETREVPAYALVLARPDQPLPQGLKKIDTDCAALSTARQRGESPPTPPLTASGMPPCGGRFGGGMVVSTGMTIARFARSIQGTTGRILIDKTGLQGDYEFTLKYTASRPGVTAPEVGDAGPDIFTALREQLGLKVEPTRTTIDFLIIEHIERPTAN